MIIRKFSIVYIFLLERQILSRKLTIQVCDMPIGICIRHKQCKELSEATFGAIKKNQSSNHMCLAAHRVPGLHPFIWEMVG